MFTAVARNVVLYVNAKRDYLSEVRAEQGDRHVRVYCVVVDPPSEEVVLIFRVVSFLL